MWACDVCLYIYTSGGATRRRYRHTTQQPNRPKNTGNNRAPKKYRRTFWEEETERSNRSGLRKQIAREAQFTATRSAACGAFALTRLRIAPRIPPRDSRFFLRVSVRFRHLRYRFFAHLSHVFALVPAAEGVREDKFSPVFSVGADDVVFHSGLYQSST